MSIARSLTLRAKRIAVDFTSPPNSPPPTGGNPSSAGLRRMGSVIDRSKISAPVELISTTNMLSYNAPDVKTLNGQGKPKQSLEQQQPEQQQHPEAPASPGAESSSASSSAAEDSDSSAAAGRSSTELTDASSVDAASPGSPKPNHLSDYFRAAQQQQQQQQQSTPVPAKKSYRKSDSSSTYTQQTVIPAAPTTITGPPAPAIPRRAHTHSKSAHLKLARKRSLQSPTPPAKLQSLASSHYHSPSKGSGGLTRANTTREKRPSLDFFRADALDDRPLSPGPVSRSSSAASFHATNSHASPFGAELEKLSEEVAEELDGALREAESEDDEEIMRSKNLARYSVEDYLLELQTLYAHARREQQEHLRHARRSRRAGMRVQPREREEWI